MVPDEVWKEFWHTLISQAGIVSFILIAAIYYLQRELAKERTAHAATAAKLLETSGTTIAALSASAEANKASTEANNRMRAVVERLLDRLGLPSNGGGY